MMRTATVTTRAVLFLTAIALASVVLLLCPAPDDASADGGAEDAGTVEATLRQGATYTWEPNYPETLNPTVTVEQTDADTGAPVNIASYQGGRFTATAPSDAPPGTRYSVILHASSSEPEQSSDTAFLFTVAEMLTLSYDIPSEVRDGTEVKWVPTVPAPYEGSWHTFSVNGSLPDGLSLDYTGAISGTVHWTEADYLPHPFAITVTVEEMRAGQSPGESVRATFLLDLSVYHAPLMNYSASDTVAGHNVTAVYSILGGNSAFQASAGDASFFLSEEDEAVFRSAGLALGSEGSIIGTALTNEDRTISVTINAEANGETVSCPVSFRIYKSSADPCTIWFKADGYAVGAVEYTPWSASIEEPEAPAKKGYSFSGWSPMYDLTLTENQTVEAVYTVNTYTVTFVAHADEEFSMTVSYKYGFASVDEPEVPAKAGYIGKWEAYDLTIAQDQTVEAIYTPTSEEFTVAFVSVADGKVSLGSAVCVSGSSLKTDGKDVLINGKAVCSAPEYEGYAFSGWYLTESGGEPVTATAVRGNMALYAHYDKGTSPEPDEPSGPDEPDGKNASESEGLDILIIALGVFGSLILLIGVLARHEITIVISMIVLGEAAYLYFFC